MDYASIAAVLGAAYLLLEDEEEQLKTRRRKVWVRDWVAKRESDGCYMKLLRELRADHTSLYRNFLRMKADDFDFLLNLCTPLIKKKDTYFRKAISAGERLAVTLRTIIRTFHIFVLATTPSRENFSDHTEYLSKSNWQIFGYLSL